VTLDSNLVSAIRSDYRTAPISEQDRIMLDYAVDLTKDATKLRLGPMHWVSGVNCNLPSPTLHNEGSV